MGNPQLFPQAGVTGIERKKNPMNARNIFLLTSILLVFRFVPVVAAQDAVPSATPAVSQPPSPNSDHPATLTPEEWKRLNAAREKAMLDPKVSEAQATLKAANEVFRSARKQALLAQDPSLGPILDKLEAALKQNPPGPQGGGIQAGPPERGGRRMGAAFGALTPEEREKLKTASEKIQENPDVVSAREKNQQAGKQFASVMHDAMLAADPTIEPLLKKVEEARQQHQWRKEGGQPPTKQ